MIPNTETAKIARLLEIKHEYEALQVTVELRIKQGYEAEMCTLTLASALLYLRQRFDWTWEDIATHIDGIYDKGHAHRIARRERGISKKGYLLATASINFCLRQGNEPEIQFPAYPDDYRSLR